MGNAKKGGLAHSMIRNLGVETEADALAILL